MDNIFEKIRALQQKPVHVRQRILYIVTGTLSTLVFLFWLSIFPSTISEVKDKSSATASSSISPFASLMAPLREAGKSISSAGKMIGSEVKYMRSQASSTLEGTITPTIEGQFASTTASTSSPNEASE